MLLLLIMMMLMMTLLLLLGHWWNSLMIPCGEFQPDAAGFLFFPHVGGLLIMTLLCAGVHTWDLGDDNGSSFSFPPLRPLCILPFFLSSSCPCSSPSVCVPPPSLLQSCHLKFSLCSNFFFYTCCLFPCIMVLSLGCVGIGVDAIRERWWDGRVPFFFFICFAFLVIRNGKRR